MKIDVRWVDFMPIAFYTWGEQLLYLQSPVTYRFYLGAVAGLIQLLILYKWNLPINYVSFAVTVYIMVSAAGLLVSSIIPIPSYLVHPIALFVWIVLLEMLALGLYFFRDVSADLKRWFAEEIVLNPSTRLLLSFGALLMSIVFINFDMTNESIATMLPFTTLISAQQILASQRLNTEL